MRFTLVLENERTLSDIERLRGNLKPEEFLLKCIVDGMRLADRESARKVPRSIDGSICLGVVEPRFHGLSKDAVMQALKDTDKSNPVSVEVRRLVEDYRRIVELRRKETGVELRKAETHSLAPIQQIALEVALNFFPHTSEKTEIRPLTKH